MVCLGAHVAHAVRVYASWGAGLRRKDIRGAPAVLASNRTNELLAACNFLLPRAPVLCVGPMREGFHIGHDLGVLLGAECKINLLETHSNTQDRSVHGSSQVAQRAHPLGYDYMGLYAAGCHFYLSDSMWKSDRSGMFPYQPGLDCFICDVRILLLSDRTT